MQASAPLTSREPWYRRVDWPTTLFLVGSPLATLVAVPTYLAHRGIEWPLVALFLVFSGVTGTCITAGYHRLFAHRSYDARPVVRWFFLLFGAGAFQGSCLKWGTDHRRHHRDVDSDEDPYNINRGFFYAHIGWLFLKDDSRFAGQWEADLERDRAVKFQHDYYVPLAFGMGFGFPALAGWLLGSAWGGLVWGGLLRVVFTQHCTFLINSLCHMIGRRPYTDKVSARDNFVLALFTYGEGYHNFHHRFAADYRNGVRWYQWDPTKWLISSLALLGLVSRLKRVPSAEILKARLQQDQTRLAARGIPLERLQALKHNIEEAQRRLKTLGEEYRRLRATVQESSRRHLVHLKAELKVARLEFKFACRQWGAYRRTLRALPVVSPVSHSR